MMSILDSSNDADLKLAECFEVHFVHILEQLVNIVHVLGDRFCLLFRNLGNLALKFFVLAQDGVHFGQIGAGSTRGLRILADALLVILSDIAIHGEGDCAAGKEL